MKNEFYSLKDYFLEMESLYEGEAVMTSFDITTEKIILDDRWIEAQVAWLNERLEKWLVDMRTNQPNILIADPLIVKDINNGSHYARMMATLSIPGGFKVRNYNSIAKSGMLNAIKKDLACKILFKYPFPGSNVYIKSNYLMPIIISMKEFKENDLSNEKNQVRIKLEESLKQRGIELTNISQSEDKNEFRAEIQTDEDFWTVKELSNSIVHIITHDLKNEGINYIR